MSARMSQGLYSGAKIAADILKKNPERIRTHVARRVRWEPLTFIPGRYGLYEEGR